MDTRKENIIVKLTFELANTIDKIITKIVSSSKINHLKPLSN